LASYCYLFWLHISCTNSIGNVISEIRKCFGKILKLNYPLAMMLHS
jgi:hypothetical protein